MTIGRGSGRVVRNKSEAKECEQIEREKRDHVVEEEKVAEVAMKEDEERWREKKFTNRERKRERYE